MIIAPRRREPGELVFAYVALMFSLFLFSQAYKIAGFESVSSAGVFPLVATGLMVLTSLVTIARAHRLQVTTESGSSALRAFRRQVTPRDFVVFTAITILYTAALDTLGFLLSSFLFLTTAIFYLHQRRLVFTIGVALVALTLIYVVFRVAFEVVLPRGWVFG
jgi:hypothetical protein